MVLFIAFLVYCTTEGYGTDDIMGIIEVPTPENLTPRGLFSVVYVLIPVRWFWPMFKGRKYIPVAKWTVGGGSARSQSPSNCWVLPQILQVKSE